ncbi:MAG TPA: cytochrome c oxidase subunit 3 [Hydrogenophaga sp.]|uniref:cytochrome c oxidase subunit 3 n=1 Tax=Hydrogenophaga sp. TaxID=1904254 RepID=UPI002B5CDC51|nr:cytochrome c oxidase subunit 3 [Hydrogenophaga sp.]HSX94903.1 cytochrome c oxidase subunit 3 [Hydrogenophaga sp.]
MTIGLVFLTLLMAAIVWWLMRQTLVEPWRAEVVVPQVRVGLAAKPAAKVALWVFLGVASSLFVLFASAYAMRLDLADWSPIPRPRLLLLNTAFLMGASLAMEWTVYAARRADIGNVRRGLAASGLLSFAFLAGQLVVWKQYHGAGFLLASSAATAFFYLFTAVHGLHVLGGLVAWARVSLRAWRGADAAHLRLASELCATYWHFLLAVWVLLYALLVSDDLGLAICSSTPL